MDSVKFPTHRSRSWLVPVPSSLLCHLRPGSLVPKCAFVLTTQLLPIVLLPIFLLPIVLFPIVHLHAQDVHPTESQVKAAYLYNFGKFVRWPVDNGAPPLDSLDICIIGKDPFGTILDSTVAGEKIDGRRIATRRISNIQEARRCSVLFVSSSEESHLATLLVAAERWSVLTVSDMRNFVERGGTIGLVMEQGRIRFEVNRRAAEQSHLVLSSELLKVATKVIEQPIPGS